MFSFFRNLFRSSRVEKLEQQVHDLQQAVDQRDQAIDRLKAEKRYYMQAASDAFRAKASKAKYDALIDDWNKLARILNQKGGWDFLNNAVMPDKLPNQFDQDEIRSLIRLCHPDRHAGSASAVRITQKLLMLRK